MNDSILKIIGICIIASLLIPVTIGLKCDSDDINTSTPSFIVIFINRIDDDGHYFFDVSNYAVEDLNNATMHIQLWGSGPFISFNNVDVNTEIFVQNLPIGESKLVKTKDQIFKVRPIFRRPLVPFFIGKMNLAFNGHSGTSPITKMLEFTQADFIFIPYP